MRWTSSRARAAAWRARAAVSDCSTIRLASVGFSSRYCISASLSTVDTCPVTSLLPSLVLVWPSNCGSWSLTLITAVSPSRTSSPLRLGSFSFRIPALRAYLLRVAVSAERKPVRCAPPSSVLMLLA